MARKKRGSKRESYRARGRVDGPWGEAAEAVRFLGTIAVMLRLGREMAAASDVVSALRAYRRTRRLERWMAAWERAHGHVSATGPVDIEALLEASRTWPREDFRALLERWMAEE